MAKKIKFNKINYNDTVANSITTLNQNFELLENTIGAQISKDVSSLQVEDVEWNTSGTNGPTSQIKLSNGAISEIKPIPSADENQSGVVTVGEQTIAGTKTFKNGIITDTITDNKHHNIVVADGNTVYVGGNGGIKLIYDTNGNLSDIEYGFLKGVDGSNISNIINQLEETYNNTLALADNSLQVFGEEYLPEEYNYGDIWFFGGIDKIQHPNKNDYDLSSFVVGNIYYCEGIYDGSENGFQTFNPIHWRVGSNVSDVTQKFAHMNSNDWLSVVEKQKLLDDWYKITGVNMSEVLGVNTLIQTIKEKQNNKSSYSTIIQKYDEMIEKYNPHTDDSDNTSFSSDIETTKTNLENSLKDIYKILVICGCEESVLSDSDLRELNIPNNLSQNYGSGKFSSKPTILSDIFNRYYSEEKKFIVELTDLQIKNATKFSQFEILLETEPYKKGDVISGTSVTSLLNSIFQDMNDRIDELSNDIHICSTYGSVQNKSIVLKNGMTLIPETGIIVRLKYESVVSSPTFSYSIENGETSETTQQIKYDDKFGSELTSIPAGYYRVKLIGNKNDNQYWLFTREPNELFDKMNTFFNKTSNFDILMIKK